MGGGWPKLEAMRCETMTARAAGIGVEEAADGSLQVTG